MRSFRDQTRERDDRFLAGGEASGESSIGLALGLVASAVGHLGLIFSLLFLPAHLPRLSPPTAYTVELVNPGALGESLGGGGKPAAGEAAARAEVAPKPQLQEPKPKPASEEPPPLPARQEPAKLEPEKKPQTGEKVEPKKPVPEKMEEKKPAEIELAKQTTPAPSLPKPTPTPPEKKQPQPTPPAPAPAASPAASRPAGQEVVKASERKERAPPAAARQTGSSSADSALDRQLAAAVERVGKPTAAGVGAGPPGEGPPSIGAGGGPGGGGLVRGIEFLVYYNAMRSRIRDSWAWVGTNEQLRATVRFGIEADGTIVNVRLVKSSGDRSYDESVVHAIGRVGKLDPPPAKYRRDFGDVELEFTPGDLGRKG